MPLDSNRKQNVIGFGDVSGGININDPAVSIGNNQAVSLINLMAKKNGFIRCPGVENLTTAGDIDGYLRGLIHHTDSSETDHLFAVWGGKLYEINKSTGAKSSALYNMTGTGEAYHGSWGGTLFLTNGTKVVKVEVSTAYQVGIAPPTTGSAAAATGGSLPDGVYKVFVCYGRKVSGTNVLYSVAYDLGSVTLGTGNNSVAITSFGNSADAQVNNKIVFMTDAGGSLYYLYHETGNNTTTSITISDTSQRNTAIDYETYAQDCVVPGSFEYMIIHNKTIFGNIGSTVYRSLKAVTVYDLEKFPSTYFKKYPYSVKGFFSIGENLYVNTVNGIYMQPGGDFSVEYIQKTHKVYFKWIRTVKNWNGAVIGLTNHGIKIFDGDRFIDANLSRDIWPDIVKMFTVDGSLNFIPCALIVQRSDRTEYTISFRDTTLGTGNNNSTYSINLDRLFIQDAVNFVAPWENRTHGFNYADIDSSGVLYMGQSHLTYSQIYKENSSHTYEKGIYNQAGTYLTNASNKRAYSKSKAIIESLFSVVWPEEIRALLLINTIATITLTIYEDISKLSSGNISANTGAKWDSAVWDVDEWPSEKPYPVRMYVKQGTNGYGMFVEFEQTANDPNLTVERLDLQYSSEMGRKR